MKELIEMTTSDMPSDADGRTAAVEHYVNIIAVEAKVEAALMLLVLRHGKQHGHWSGDPATLEDALWEIAGIEGATLEIDVRQLPCIARWCVFDTEIRDGKLFVTVTNTVVK